MNITAASESSELRGSASGEDMKMAVVGPAYPFRGGIAHYTALLAANLHYQHDTRLYSFRQQYPDRLFPGRSQIDPSSNPLAEVEARHWLIPWWPLSWRRVTQDWKVWQPDRVVVQWWVPFMAPMTAWLLQQARRDHIRSIVICHNVLPHERSRVDQFLARLALRQADQLIVHSTMQQTLAKDLLPGCATTVTPHPSYADFQSSKWTRERARDELQLAGPVLLFFGLVRPYKGLFDLIDALPTVLKEIDVALLVVGEVWGDASVYQARVNELNLRAKVRFVDHYVPNDEVAKYFAAADLVALPYREATGSGVLQLAFGLGVPVIATRTGGMDEVVEDGVTGFLVAPGDVSSLGRAIKRFFQEDCEALFRENVRLRQGAFTWQRMVQAIEAASA